MTVLELEERSARTRTGPVLRPRRAGGERGAAAVEFALVAPLLLLMVLGIIELGRTYFVQATISQAAREGARTLATGGNAAAVRTATRSAATGITLTDGQIVLVPSTCSGAAASSTASVTVSYRVEHLTGVGATGTLLIGRGVMRCER